MANVAIKLSFDAPYPNPVHIETTPVFPVTPDPTAWGEWILRNDDSSLVSEVGTSTLIVNGTAPGPLQFTENSYVPFNYPNGLVANGFTDTDNQTLIFAIKRTLSQSKWIGGSLAITPSRGSGAIALAGNSIQFAKAVGGSNVTASIPSSEIPSNVGDIVIVAIVDDGENLYGYVHGATTVAQINGIKTPGESPGAGNSFYNVSNYLTSPEYLGLRFYNRALNEQDVRKSMSQFLRRVQS